MVLVALYVAAPALQSRRWLEHVPQWLGACLTVGGEVVECGDKLVALVADVAGLLSNGQWLHRKFWFLLAFAFIGIKNLESGICEFVKGQPLKSMINNKMVKAVQGQTWNILGISLASARYTSV